MASIYTWDTDAAQNANSDSSIDWSEGMAPSGVNDSARFMMARVAELLADLGGALIAAGSANAITLTTESAFTAYEDGQIAAFRAIADNTGSTTLNVNNIGAKPLVKMSRSGEASLAAGDVQDTGIYVARYSTELNSANGAWLLLNATPENVATALSGLSTKTTPVNADSLVLVDSEASDIGKRVLWSKVTPSARQVVGGGLASGGGDLTADRTITVTAATQAEAEAGTDNTKVLTPLRGKQSAAQVISDMTIGYGQTWQNVTSSRSGSSTAYQNATGRPIVVSIQSGTNGFLQVSVNGSSSWVRVADTSTAAGISISAVIPVDHYYRFTAGSFEYWAELR